MSEVRIRSKPDLYSGTIKVLVCSHGVLPLHPSKLNLEK